MRTAVRAKQQHVHELEYYFMKASKVLKPTDRYHFANLHDVRHEILDENDTLLPKVHLHVSEHAVH